MSETGSHYLKPESQSVGKCAELREALQDKTFDKMDEHHETQMTAIGNVDRKMAFMEGQQKAKSIKNGNGKISGVIIKILITCAPYIAFIMTIGIATWLKSKGWL